MRAHGIIRVDVFKLDHAAPGHQKNGRNRQQVMACARRGFNIHAMLRQGIERRFVHSVGHSETFAHVHGAVRKQREPDTELLTCILEIGRLVRRNRNDLESELIELRFNVAQLTQLPLAVRSPAAAIEHQQRRPGLDGVIQVERHSLS